MTARRRLVFPDEAASTREKLGFTANSKVAVPDCTGEMVVPHNCTEGSTERAPPKDVLTCIRELESLAIVWL
eukprot:CAMPEP_0180172402 /NCGR_PEP_ID=MMETSP0986-20121125/34998_1 /TAXON_ID=697907 /ORGANISM="non described non described, Strain CCMP2293" /LENGTH=71 /DNA_ID=CAMNT_0022124471 /DNA_START=983 /DNA_END=1198 /DNA_ORIENTATION=+